MAAPSADLATFDVVVLGAGPAGAALAIDCLSRQLRVLMLEPCAYPRATPGETLHPGAETVLAHLGVWDDVRRCAVIRPEGIMVKWGTPERLERYGGAPSRPWRGCQIARSDLDLSLLGRARSLGAVVWQPCRPIRLLTEGARICGVVTTRGEIRARWVVDATGRAAWLVRRLRLEASLCSVPLVAAYGYVEAAASSSDVPRVSADPDGWTWQARISPGAEAWVRTTPAAAHPSRHWVPAALRARRVLAPARFVDVGWRVVVRPAGPGYLVVGDAAARLDPARSSGVLKAMVSGITSAACLTSILLDGAVEANAMAAYTRYVHASFSSDARALSQSYAVFPWWTPFESYSSLGEVHGAH